MCRSTFKVFARQPSAQSVLGCDECVATGEDS